MLLKSFFGYTSVSISSSIDVESLISTASWISSSISPLKSFKSMFSSSEISEADSKSWFSISSLLPGEFSKSSSSWSSSNSFTSFSLLRNFRTDLSNCFWSWTLLIISDFIFSVDESSLYFSIKSLITIFDSSLRSKFASSFNHKFAPWDR